MILNIENDIIFQMSILIYIYYEKFFSGHKGDASLCYIIGVFRGSSLCTSWLHDVALGILRRNIFLFILAVKEWLCQAKFCKKLG